VLQAYFEQRIRHPAGKIFDHYAYKSHSERHLACSKDTPIVLKLEHNVSEAMQILERVKEKPQNYDIHG
jgi:hypothetical protein